MKLLIIAGPYEADRIRRAAVSAGFETVAVEPGESLSGWITASRPDLIVMAPQIVSPDPAVALGKVRSVPRGRVPIFLVGDAADQARMEGLGADGFFVRPVSTADLLGRARSLLNAAGDGSAPRRSGSHTAVTSDARRSDSHPIVAGDARRSDSHPIVAGDAGIPVTVGESPSGDQARKSGAQAAPAPNKLTLKPLVSAADASGPAVVPKARPSEAGALFVKLAESIDATLDAEMRDMARSLGSLRPLAPEPGATIVKRPELERTPMAPMTALVAAVLPQLEPEPLSVEAAAEAAEELGDETGQKTVKVPRDVFAKMITERAASRGRPDQMVGGPAPVESGKIADTDVASLFGRLAVQRLTGRLVLKRAGFEKAIYFDRGAPVLASSSDQQDRMGDMLVRQGRLTDAQQSEGFEAVSKTGRRLGAALARLGIIKLSELPGIVRRHYEEIIHSVFAWEEGEWSLGPERPSKEENVFLTEHPAAIILEGIRRKYGASRLRRCLGGGGQIFSLPAAVGTSEVLLRMRLTHEERAMLPFFDGVRTLDEVCALSEAPGDVVAGIAWALSVLGHLERAEPRREEVEPAAEAPGANGQNGQSAAPPTREPALGHTRDREIDRARVLARHALVEEADYFQILGVPRTASAHEVRRAHQALMREFAPAALDPVLAVELAAELRAIRTVLDEALRVLGEPGLRERYQTRLPAAPRRAPE
jgi:hypothetical protein